MCFSAGGPNDIVARIIGKYLSDYLGQQFIKPSWASKSAMWCAWAATMRKSLR